VTREELRRLAEAEEARLRAMEEHQRRMDRLVQESLDEDAVHKLMTQKSHEHAQRTGARGDSGEHEVDPLARDMFGEVEQFFDEQLEEARRRLRERAAQPIPKRDDDWRR
jgi:hypothetical protein